MIKEKHSARMLMVDILLPALLLLGLAVLLIFQQRGYSGTGANIPDDMLIDEDHWAEVRAEKPPAAARVLLVSTGDEEAEAVREQVAFVAAAMGMNPCNHIISRLDDDPEPEEDVSALAESEDEGFALAEPGDDVSALAESEDEVPARPASTNEVSAQPAAAGVEPAALTDVAGLYEDTEILVICESDLHTLPIDVEALAAWVSEGGRLIIAGGLESSELASEWASLLGVIPMDEYPIIPIESMRLQTSLLAGGQGMEFSDEVIRTDMTRVQLLPGILVHVTTADESETPLLWELPYGDGLVLVNGAVPMDGKANRGMICACFGRMEEIAVWPVINAAVYCIDDFPSCAPAGFDSNVRLQYGYTVSDFYFIVWWPSVREIGRKYEIPYSCFLIQCYDADTEGPFDNRDYTASASYFARQILENGGEIGIHGYNHQPLVLEGYTYDEKNSGYHPWPSNSRMVESIRSLTAYAAELSPDIELRAYVAPSNVLDENGMSLLTEHFEDLRVFAGVYIGTPDQMVQEYEALDNGVVLVPRLTADMQMEDSEWWTQLNALNFQFVESNYIHPDDILDEERNDGGDFNAMLAGYERMVAWNQAHGLRARTISQAGGAVQRYCNLSVEKEEDEAGLTLHLSGLIDTGSLLIRLRETGRVPECTEGGTLTMVDDGLWLLEADADLVRIEWK